MTATLKRDSMGHTLKVRNTTQNNMNTQPETKDRKFNRSEAPKLPVLACLGYISSVGDQDVSKKSGVYNVVPIEITGFGAAPGKNAYLCFRPEWIDENFDPQDLDGIEGNPKFVYGKNIATVEDDGILQSGKGEIKGLLAGLCGSADRFQALQNDLLGLADSGEVDPDDVRDIIAKHLENDETGEPRKIGYILRQERVKTGKTKDDGKAEYIRGKNYDLSGFFYATEDNIKSYRKKAENAAAKAAKAEKKEDQKPNFRVAFDDEVPY